MIWPISFHHTSYSLLVWMVGVLFDRRFPMEHTRYYPITKNTKLFIILGCTTLKIPQVTCQLSNTLNIPMQEYNFCGSNSNFVHHYFHFFISFRWGLWCKDHHNIYHLVEFIIDVWKTFCSNRWIGFQWRKNYNLYYMAKFERWVEW